MRPLFALAALVALVVAAVSAGTAMSASGSNLAIVRMAVHLPADTVVRFHDIGGRCELNKAVPVAYSQTFNNNATTLFRTKVDGSCLFERSDAQYKIVATLKDGRSYWSNVNIVQLHLALPNFVAHCYGNGTLPCQGGHNSPGLTEASKEIPLMLGPIPGSS